MDYYFDLLMEIRDENPIGIRVKNKKLHSNDSTIIRKNIQYNIPYIAHVYIAICWDTSNFQFPKQLVLSNTGIQQKHVSIDWYFARFYH